MKSKIEFIIIIVCLITASIYLNDRVRSFFLLGTEYIINEISSLEQSIENTISEHFFQAEEIRALRALNAKLEHEASLTSTYAYELNNFLEDKNSSKYEPNVSLVKALSYESIGDYNKIWLDFKDFNSSNVYGLIKDAKTAGIVTSKANKPLAILQTDPECVFSVFIGKNKIAGIANGNYKNIKVKYIYQWLNPKVGDKVYTSGLDGIFFPGILVGKVLKIEEKDFYKSAIIEPDNKLNIPSYLYAITKTY